MDTLKAPATSAVCLVISGAGVIILLLLALAFENKAEVVMGHTDDPKDGHAVAVQLTGAAVIYAGFLALSAMRLFVASRGGRRGDIRL